jgi:heparan sulfate N-deacetylase/N-sulfotransferase NDST2
LKDQKYKKNIIAEKNSFVDILKSTNDSDLNIFNLKQKCISPGHYHKHLLEWFNKFHSNQILIIDSEVFKNNPMNDLERIQEFLKLKKKINYEEILKKDNNKEFTYCLKKDLRKCTSFNKKPIIEQNIYDLLDNIYSESNKKLKSLLNEYKFKKPEWLDKY